MAYRILAMLTLSGCAAFAPPRPLTNEAEALAVHGEPMQRWDNGDGTTTLEYSTQPHGHRALMVTRRRERRRDQPVRRALRRESRPGQAGHDAGPSVAPARHAPLGAGVQAQRRQM
jgi:hypothetical protein